MRRARLRKRGRRWPGLLHLQVDNLKTPLGIDDPAPKFSWQLRDATPGAKQTAYEVQVATRAELLSGDTADVWTSGRVESGESIGISYAGPALKASTRYYWRVKLWGASGGAYAESETSSWETGLMEQNEPPQPSAWRAGQGPGGPMRAAAWHAQWIGYETPEEAAVRQAPAQWIANPDAKTPEADVKCQSSASLIAQRSHFRELVRSAALYATGRTRFPRG